MEKARELIQDALQSAVAHPVFMGFPADGITDDDIETEGGDAAFVTADIAWRLKEALDILTLQGAKIDSAQILNDLSLVMECPVEELVEKVTKMRDKIAYAREHSELVSRGAENLILVPYSFIKD